MVVATIALAGFVVLAAISHAGGSLFRPVVAGLAVFAIMYLVAFATAGGVGLGDVKLGGVLAVYLGWFGWSQVVMGLAGGLVVAGLWAIARLAGGRADRRSQIPLGPFLIAAAFVVAAAG
jgi:leader peptidase (prepilin peptidase)/N-methyltransferase